MNEGQLQCSVCQKRFLRRTNYFKHMEQDVHQIKLERDSIQDSALKAYSSAIELYTPVSTKLAEQFLQSSIDNNEDGGAPEKQEGWALPVSRKSVRFNNNQKDFVAKIFEAGEADSTKKKKSSAIVEMMKSARINNQPRFSIAELLTEKKVNGIIRSLKKKKGKTSLQPTPSSQINEDETEDLDEDDDNGQPPNDELFFDSVVENAGDIFE